MGADTKRDAESITFLNLDIHVANIVHLFNMARSNAFCLKNDWCSLSSCHAVYFAHIWSCNGNNAVIYNYNQAINCCEKAKSRNGTIETGCAS